MSQFTHRKWIFIGLLKHRRYEFFCVTGYGIILPEYLVVVRHISETTRDIKMNFSGHIPGIMGQVYKPNKSFGLTYWLVYDQLCYEKVA